MERIRDSLRRSVESYQRSSGKTGIAPEEEAKTIARIKTSMDRHDLLHCDILIEAVVEEEAAKESYLSLRNGLSQAIRVEHFLYFDHTACQFLLVAGQSDWDALYESGSGSARLRVDPGLSDFRGDISERA
jgi:hypothetical protein